MARTTGHNLTRRVGAAVLVVAFIVPLLPISGVQAATHCVNPSSTGGCFASIQSAVDASSAGDTVTVAAGTYPEHLTITTSGTSASMPLTITGTGATIIDGTQSGTVLTVGQDVAVTISGMTIRNGKYTQCVVKNRYGSYTGGVGIVNSGLLTLTASTVSGNVNDQPPPNCGPGQAGGIYNDNSLTMVGSTVSNNTSTNSVGGIDNENSLTMTGSTVSDNTSMSNIGGLYSNGTATLTDSVFRRNHFTASPNSSRSEYVAGGIYNDRFMAMVRTTVADNTSTDGSGNPTFGGGITNNQYLSMTDSTFTGNTGNGIFNRAVFSMTGSTVSGNHAASGGGIYNEAEMSIANTTISGNTAGDGGGMVSGDATMNNVTVRDNTAAGQGGGIDSFGTLNLSNSTVSSNAATDGGGIYTRTSGGTTLVNSTLSGNSTTGRGGGLYNSSIALFIVTSIVFPITGYWIYYSAVATLIDSTVSNNSSGNGSGLFNETVSGGSSCGANVSTSPCASIVNVTDSIVAGDVGSSDITGYFSTGGHNLIGNASGGSGFTGAGDLTNLDAHLGPLADNGGPTQTHALLSGSPAIDKVPVSGAYCQRTDQRGVARPQGAACDSGAYEAQVLPLPVPRPGPPVTGTPTPLPPPRPTAPVLMPTPNPLPPHR